MSIQHIEEVGFWHHAHSFVWGNWRKAEQSSPMILQNVATTWTSFYGWQKVNVSKSVPLEG